MPHGAALESRVEKIPAGSRLLTKRQLNEKLGGNPGSTGVVDRLRREDVCFPLPIKLSDAFNGASRWLEHEVDAWIAKRSNERAEEQQAERSRRAAEVARSGAQVGRPRKVAG